MIYFLIKYDKRYDHLIEHLSKMLLILYNYKDNITIFTTINDPHSLTLCYLLENLKI